MKQMGVKCIKCIKRNPVGAMTLCEKCAPIQGRTSPINRIPAQYGIGYPEGWIRRKYSGLPLTSHLHQQKSARQKHGRNVCSDRGPVSCVARNNTQTNTGSAVTGATGLGNGTGGHSVTCAAIFWGRKLDAGSFPCMEKKTKIPF